MTAGPTRRRVLRSLARIASIAIVVPRVTSRAATQAQIPIIDAHTHIVRSLRQDREGGRGRGGGFGERSVNLEEAVVAALELMNLCVPIMPSERSADGDRRAK